MNATLAAAVVLLGGSAATIAPRPTDLVDVTTLDPHIQIELKYATEDNFMKKSVYGQYKQCLLRKKPAQMLAKASRNLRERFPDLRLHVYDCLRPRSVQIEMWKVVKGTPGQAYVANPYGKTGSIHNYGCAVDLTVFNEDQPLDMGTPFDHFGKEAHVDGEARMLERGQITHAQLLNRFILRDAMVGAGFLPLPTEWWHFNCATKKETRKLYKIVE